MGKTPASARSATISSMPGQGRPAKYAYCTRAGGSAVLDDLGADRARDPRAEPVRADDEPGGEVDRRAAAVVPVHPDGPTGVVEAHARRR